jgi:hypothetical protein
MHIVYSIAFSEGDRHARCYCELTVPAAGVESPQSNRLLTPDPSVLAWPANLCSLGDGQSSIE